MNDSAVSNYGVDSSGRAILMTAYMAQWWEGVVAALGFEPTIVQGAFMARVPGGGAAGSEGYHDGGGCLDLRTWNLTAAQKETLVRTLRRHGAGAWRRDARHGMDPHLHLVLGTDHGLDPAAAAQWREYLAGGDGLEGSGRDYEWRPDPIVINPPEEDDMPYTEKELTDLVRAAVKAELADVGDVKLDVGKDAKWSLGRVLSALLARDSAGKP